MDMVHEVKYSQQNELLNELQLAGINGTGVDNLQVQTLGECMNINNEGSIHQDVCTPHLLNLFQAIGHAVEEPQQYWFAEPDMITPAHLFLAPAFIPEYIQGVALGIYPPPILQSYSNHSQIDMTGSLEERPGYDSHLPD